MLAKRKRSHDAAINTLRHLQLTFTGVQTGLKPKERRRDSARDREIEIEKERERDGIVPSLPDC